MNVVINGYITFNCNSCNKVHTLESQSLNFVEDATEEAEGDDYIRYLAEIDTQCPACAAPVLVKVDVWEFPASMVNYCYYQEQGVNDVQCEFSIEHYFDDQAMKEEDLEYEQLEESDNMEGDDPDEEDDQHAPPSAERYMDSYDDDD